MHLLLLLLRVSGIVLVLQVVLVFVLLATDVALKLFLIGQFEMGLLVSKHIALFAECFLTNCAYKFSRFCWGFWEL